jgi:hypothetical protein
METLNCIAVARWKFTCVPAPFPAIHRTHGIAPWSQTLHPLLPAMEEAEATP